MRATQNMHIILLPHRSVWLTNILLHHRQPTRRRVHTLLMAAMHIKSPLICIIGSASECIYFNVLHVATSQHKRRL